MFNYNYDFTTAEGRQAFIQTEESGIYEGINADGDKVFIFLEKCQGMDIWTNHKVKPKWWEVVAYDAYGYPESVSYEPEEDGGI